MRRYQRDILFRLRPLPKPKFSVIQILTCVNNGARTDSKGSPEGFERRHRRVITSVTVKFRPGLKLSNYLSAYHLRSTR